MELAGYLVSKKRIIIGMARGYGLDNDSAQDIFQEVSLKLIEKSGTFRGDSSFDTFVYKIAKNEILMYLRSEQSNERKNFIYEILRPATENPEQLMCLSVRNSGIDFLLSSAHAFLNKRDAATFRAELEFILEGEYASELALAEMLNVPITNLKNRRFTMRKNIRKVLDRDLFF